MRIQFLYFFNQNNYLEFFKITPWDLNRTIFRIFCIMSMGIKKPSEWEGFWRFRADSNRCRRFCRPLPSHSATKPINWDANLAFF
ncbi:MAG: hypothetical protein RL045_1446 [Bacteroidota bacterium]